MPFTFADFEFIRSADVITSSNRNSYDHWMRQSADKIVDDILNGKQKIIVDDTGRIWNGHTRLFALVAKGYDIRQIIPLLREEHRK